MILTSSKDGDDDEIPGVADWFQDLADVIVPQQNPAGYWPSSPAYVWPDGTYGTMVDELLSTLWALLVLERVAPPASDDRFRVELCADQETDVGEVIVWIEGGNLSVQYVVDEPWILTYSYLYVGRTDPVDFPSTPGQFPYNPKMNKNPSPGASIDPGNTTYTIPLDEIYEYSLVKKKLVADTASGGPFPAPIYIAAHARVEQVVMVGETPVIIEETAWGAA
jgi:hypothetical protein